MSEVNGTLPAQYIQEAEEAKAAAAVKVLKEAYVNIAQTYIRAAESFTTGSQGWNGNMREAAKYCNLAAGAVEER